MSLLQWTGRIFNQMIRPRKMGSGWWYRFFSTSNTWKEVDFLDAFHDVPELNAVINIKGRAHSNGIYKHVDADGNVLNSPLNKVLNGPNWFQAQKEFIRQCTLFHEIFGNEFIYALYPVGMPQKIKALYTIPPNLISVEYHERTPFFFYDQMPNIKYVLKYDGIEKEIDPDQIIHLNDNRVTVKSPVDKDLMKGESKIKPLRAVINNIKMAYESRGVILKHRGAMGILTNAGKDGVGSPLPLDKEEITRLQSEYAKYGGLEDQFNIVISDSNLKWQQMGANPDRLGLFEEIEKDFDKILDAFGVPPEMFASKVGATYENQRQAEKGLYVRTIIPEANERAAALTERLLPEGSTDRIDVDFSHLPIFQEDLKERGQSLAITVNALSAALRDGAITIEQYQNELNRFGIEPVPLPSPEEEEEAPQPSSNGKAHGTYY